MNGQTSLLRRVLLAVFVGGMLLGAVGCGSGMRPAARVSGASDAARVSGLLAVCPATDSPCPPGSGSVYAIDVKHRVLASQRVSHGRFSFSLPPGRYMLHANQRYGWCHRYDTCNVYRAVLAVAHQQLRVELEVPPPPCRTARGRGTLRRPAGVYRDPAGWTIEVPRGWRLVRFSGAHGNVSGAGAQISNVRLPAPKVLPGYPIQSPLSAHPAGGVGLVIATDSETGLPGRSHGSIKVPPLPSPDQCGWSAGSAYGGQPYLETLWFKGNGKTFIASVKVGAKAARTDLATVDRIVHSLRFQSARH
jgi:hypothetical protein